MEYNRKQDWKDRGYHVVRSAGSHGLWDLCAVKYDEPVNLIQCKSTETPTVARRLIREFKSNPPLCPSKYFHQILEVKIKGSTDITTVIV